MCLILGLAVGGIAGRALARRHQHTHAVMWLAQIHLQRLDQAARSRDCVGLASELDSLIPLQQELVQAFPLAYQQDGEFRARADALRSALRQAAGPGQACDAALRVQPVRESCDACHREYR